MREYNERERAHMTNESYARYYNSPSKKDSGIISGVAFFAIGLLMLAFIFCKYFGWCV
jgi:hypothetical protein